MSAKATILLLEDEPLILMDLEFAAEELGCEPYCATTVAQALTYLERDAPPINVAVLDVTLQDGENCLPVARELERRGIPYLLHSGDLNRQNERIRELDAELIPKPASSERVIGRAMEYVEDTKAHCSTR